LILLLWERIESSVTSRPCNGTSNQRRYSQIGDQRAKLIAHEAFVDGELGAPQSFLPEMHCLYFKPEYSEFSARSYSALQPEDRRARSGQLAAQPNYSASAIAPAERAHRLHN